MPDSVNPGPRTPPPLFPDKAASPVRPSLPFSGAEAQPWYTSKTTWVGIAGVASGLLGLAGFAIEKEQVESLAGAAAAIGTGLSTAGPALLALYGLLTVIFRRKASAPIKNGPADPAKK